MAFPEKTKIWSAMKAALPAINRSGTNGVEFLVWSQDKSLEEVKERIKFIRENDKEKFQEESKQREERMNPEIKEDNQPKSNQISKDQRS